VVPSPKAARGVIVYIGLDESKAAADGTNLSAIAGELQAYAKELASQAETQAVIALAPEGRGSDIDAVRAVATGSPAATGAPAANHGPVPSRIPNRIHTPTLREEHAPAPEDPGGYGGRAREVNPDADGQRPRKHNPRREELISAVWSDGEVHDERTVDVHIRRLRRRLGEYASVVRTMRGSGYRYDTHPDVTVWSATARH